jgi:ABC-2 type transport system ATP-binding protein
LTSPSDNVLAAEGLWKRYGRRRPWVIQDVSIGVPAGTITAIVGPNSAGKSTLIRTWMGFERPTQGRVTVDGIDPWRHRSAALARIGYVPQAASLYRDLTVREHLQLARILRPQFEAEIARRHLITLGIPPRQKAGELSGGQQAQLGLAIALGTTAPVLLLDEPLASLDPLARRDFLKILVDAVRTDGRTAFLSSHIVTDVEEACDRLIVLAGGRILLDESVASARALHTVSVNGAGLADSVGSFSAADGATLTLLRREVHSDAPQATLEEIVLGYLSAGQRRASVEAEWAAA